MGMISKIYGSPYYWREIGETKEARKKRRRAEMRERRMMKKLKARLPSVLSGKSLSRQASPEKVTSGTTTVSVEAEGNRGKSGTLKE